MTIGTNTLCYIVRTASGNERLLGRVVEVISPAVLMPGFDVPMHEIEAPWLHVECPDAVGYFAPPSSLRPITPPGTTTARRTREPVTT